MYTDHILLRDIFILQYVYNSGDHIYEIMTRICFPFSDPRMLKTSLANLFTYKDSKPIAFQQLQDIGHVVVPTFERKLRPCAFCSMCKIKTKKGWRVYTRYKCSGCDVPLCTKHRDCFLVYHTTLLQSISSSSPLWTFQQTSSFPVK